MKSTALITTVALVASAFSVAANAQTGRPSTEEAPAAAVSQVQDDAQVGSYARYLMLNGMTRDRAIVAAASYDHPAARPSRVARARTTIAPATASTPVQQ